MSEVVRLGDVCSKASSNIAQKDLDENEGSYPVYGAAGFIKNVDFYQQEKPYIAVVKDGAGIGRVMKLPGRSSVIGTMQYILPAENVDISYLAYGMEHMNLSRYYSGSAIPHIYFKDYQKETIKLPPLSEQRRIAAILDKVDSLIALRQQQLDKLDELVKARFVEMFGQNRALLENWESIQLDDIADVGSSKRVFVSELKSEGIPFYRGTEIGALAEGKEILPDLYITEDHYASLVKITGAPQPGDLLLPSICYDGRIWLVDTTVPFYFKDGRVLWIHPKDKRFRSTYLQYSLKEKIVKDYLKLASGTTFSELKIFTLKSLQITLPPREMQIEFEIFVGKIKEIKRSVNYGLTTLRTLKASLMQQYFS